VADVPANQIVLKVQPQPNATPQGNLYFVCISEEDGMDFLVHGFERAVTENGKGIFREIQGEKLKGKKATKAELLKALDALDGKAKADDVVMVFIACHGTCNPKTPTGESVFSTRNGSVKPRDVKSRLGKLPCQSIVVNDACCSGNWHKELPGDPMPDNISVMACCQYNQGSINEFDITVFEGLFGKADFNKDGIVDLDELITYTKYRMREVVGGELIPSLHKAKSLTKPLPLTKVNNKLVTVVHGKEVFTGVVEDKDGDNFEVHVLGFTQKGRKAGYGGGRVKHNYPRSQIILPSDGSALMVKKETGGWFPAVSLGKSGDDHKVRFIGSEGEAVATSADVRHLFAGNPSEEIPTGLFMKRKG